MCRKSVNINCSCTIFFYFICGIFLCAPGLADDFEGTYFSGNGDVEYLELLDISRRMFSPDPEFQNTSMLYTPWWNGFVEGPTWDAWWVQNSYGPTYCSLPFLEEPYITFLQNAQDLWFDQMGDGVRVGAKDWIAPDGCLCDCARPGWIMYKQGDGRTDDHDWGMEFTAAGVLLQSELLLISRDAQAIEHYLPKLERSANFIETRRDTTNDLFLAGPAGNLLAPSFAGWKQADGSFKKSYLTGLSITYIAALDRLIELEKLAGHKKKSKMYQDRRDHAQKGLGQLTTAEGSFIKSLDPDGIKHGVYGAEKHGYFESSPNHDAIAFRVVENQQAAKIYDKIASIPGLRRHHFIVANEPGLDDMYDPGTSWLWQHGTWVNGGHWSTCEARMIMGYYRLGKYEDARKSMQHLLTFAREFRMDNPLVEWGSKVYQPKEPINLCYDSFGPPAAMVRGLFEYLYKAESLILLPHIPDGITQISQHFPIRFGSKELYLSATGTGPISGVYINGKKWSSFENESIKLDYESIPQQANVQILLGGAKFNQVASAINERRSDHDRALEFKFAESDQSSGNKNVKRMQLFLSLLLEQNLQNTYEASHAALAVEAAQALQERRLMLAQGALTSLPEPAFSAADKMYENTIFNLNEGFIKVLNSYAGSDDPKQMNIYQLWIETKE